MSLFWKVIIVNVIIFVSIVALLEMIAAGKIDFLTSCHSIGRIEIDPDDRMAFRPKKNSIYKVKKICKDQILYDVTYRFDEYRRRILDVKDVQDKSGKKFALFFGASNTLGEGVGSTETLPYYFSQLNPEYHSYNYAFGGYGPQQMLALLQTTDLSKEILEREGVLFYQYFSFLRTRLLGGLHSSRWSKGRFPKYSLNGDKLVYEGFFSDTNPVRTGILNFLSKSTSLQYLRYDWPPYFSAYANDLTCAVFTESKRLFVEQFPASEFVVVVGIPSVDEDNIIENCLLPNKIKYIDMRGTWDKKERGHIAIQPPYEYHFRKEVHRFVAQYLNKSLQEL